MNHLRLPRTVLESVALVTEYSALQAQLIVHISATLTGQVPSALLPGHNTFVEALLIQRRVVNTLLNRNLMEIRQN